MPPQKLLLAGSNLNSHQLQKPLDLHLLSPPLGTNPFAEDTLVGCMLIDEIEPLRPFGQDVAAG